MSKLGIPDPFILMVKMLLQDASASVLLNGQSTAQFLILCGVRQGCPLAPYLFLMIGEALNIAAKEEQRLGNIQGILLSDNDTRQLITQFADDTGFFFIGNRSVPQEYYRTPPQIWHSNRTHHQLGEKHRLLVFVTPLPGLASSV